MKRLDDVNKIKIISKDNAKIKELKRLGQKKFRKESGRFLVENAVIIQDATKAGFLFEEIFITTEFVEKNKSKFESIIKESRINEYYLIDERTNKSFSSLDTAPGIVAVYSKPENQIDFTKPIVYLNAINDPGNLGAILRSALAFGLNNIVIDEQCADVYNSKTISAAKDSIFKLNIKFDRDFEILKEIKEKMPIFSTRLEKSNGLEVLKKQDLFCIVFGSESHGVEKVIQEISDNFIKIPINNEIESLNVAVSAGIVFYEIYSRVK